MEVVRLAGYDLEDKVAIARQHLVPKALEEAGLTDTSGVSFDDDALVALIRGHAREAGVRTLQKLVEKIGRKVALRVVRDADPEAMKTRPESEKGSGYAVTVDTLEDFVGKPLLKDGCTTMLPRSGSSWARWDEYGRRGACMSKLPNSVEATRARRNCRPPDNWAVSWRKARGSR